MILLRLMWRQVRLLESLTVRRETGEVQIYRVSKEILKHVSTQKGQNSKWTERRSTQGYD